jgi:hypothetical protein
MGRMEKREIGLEDYLVVAKYKGTVKANNLLLKDKNSKLKNHQHIQAHLDTLTNARLLRN